MIRVLPRAFFLCAAVALLAAAPAFSAGYTLGAGDILAISVYEQEDLKQEVRVSEDGTVNLPLVGVLKAEGLSVEAIERDLTERYGEFIRDPQVQVFVKEYHSKEISVLGEVNRPGLYKLSGNTSLLEVLSIVGGLKENHAANLVVLREPKREGQEPVNIVVDTRRLFTPEGMDLNIQVLDGDVIHVPRVERSTETFFLIGEVVKPGSYEMPKGTNLTVLKAVTLAGGFTDRAAKGRIKIRREVGDQVMEFKVELDAAIRPQDVVMVPESFF